MLFALAPEPLQISQAQSQAIQVVRLENHWSYQRENSTVPLRPFWQITDEIYQTYWKIQA